MKNEASTLCIPAIAYNIDAEDDYGPVDDRYVDFAEAGRILYSATTALRGACDILENDNEGCPHKNSLLQAALEAIADDLGRILPSGASSCMVRIKDVSDELSRELERQEGAAARLRATLSYVRNNHEGLQSQLHKLAGKTSQLRGELRQEKERLEEVAHEA